MDWCYVSAAWSVFDPLRIGVSAVWCVFDPLRIGVMSMQCGVCDPLWIGVTSVHRGLCLIHCGSVLCQCSVGCVCSFEDWCYCCHIHF